MERLSSEFTFFYKFVLTAVWLVVFTAIGLGSIFAGTSVSWVARFLPAVPAAFMAFLTWSMFRTLKKVELCGTTLEISNYRDSISVPLSEIDCVSETPWVARQVRITTVTFKHPTAFGDSVAFVPPFSFAFFSEHEVTRRLRLLAVGGSGSPA